MGLYTDRILPHLVHRVLKAPALGDLRRAYLARARGALLDIGFGSGLNLPHLPSAVSRVYALEPSDVAWRLARPLLETCPVPVERLGLSGEVIPLGDDSVDTVVTTWTLCTIPDAERALAEIRRVLRTGGLYCFLEHGLAPDSSVAAWQRRLNPLQRRLAGGCHLDRPMAELIRQAGFELHGLRTFYLPGPRVGTFMYAGRATESTDAPARAEASAP